MGQKTNNQAGFTIVELLIVIVIIGILAAITIVAFNGVQRRAAIAVIQSDLTAAKKTLEIDNTTSGAYPATASAANNNAGLSASSGTTYQYTYTAGDNSYCLTATNGTLSYFVSNTNQTAQTGACTGHTAGGISFDQPATCPTNFIPVPGNSQFDTQGGFCIMKYEARNVSNVPTSQTTGSIWGGLTQTDAITRAQTSCSGCHLVSENEWLTVAHNVVSVAANWSGGAVGSGYLYSGHNDNVPANFLDASANDADGYVGTGNPGTNQKRTLTLTNGQVIWDFAGNAGEWTAGTMAGNVQPGVTGEAGAFWKEWNASNVVQGSLSTRANPPYGTPVASGWTSAQGIGKLFSYRGNSSTATHGFIRGGSYTNEENAGVFMLNTSNAASSVNANRAFRVAR